MAVIGISLNEVLRDYVQQVVYTYNKYYVKDLEEIGGVKIPEIKEEDITSFDFVKHLNFDNIDKLNHFLFVEAPLEIFGHADQVSNGIMNSFNTFLTEMEFEGEHEIEIVSREANKAIPATFFFLSKTGAKPKKIRFVKSFEEKWDGIDVLITANPEALAAKPQDKISVKIKCSYNTDAKADYELDSILEFFKNADLRKKILTKAITINFEEIE
jgi:hypothetical protein